MSEVKRYEVLKARLALKTDQGTFTPGYSGWNVVVLASDYDALAADVARLREALEVVLDDLMYADHGRVIDFARAALALQEKS